MGAGRSVTHSTHTQYNSDCLQSLRSIRTRPLSAVYRGFRTPLSPKQIQVGQKARRQSQDAPQGSAQLLARRGSRYASLAGNRERLRVAGGGPEPRNPCRGLNRPMLTHTFQIVRPCGPGASEGDKDSVRIHPWAKSTQMIVMGLDIPSRSLPCLRQCSLPNPYLMRIATICTQCRFSLENTTQRSNLAEPGQLPNQHR